MMPHKGASTQCHNQQALAKPHHQPSDRDQQAREKLKQKVSVHSTRRRDPTNCTSNIPTRHTGHSPFTGISGWLIRLKFKFTSHFVCHTRWHKLSADYGLLLY